ncbi:Solute carrier organic anion transporter family member 1A1 [Halotydeus destructor]|nr:Solute carrier organic anion transporter family member 1A1 [Halotydeus destructor]
MADTDTSANSQIKVHWKDRFASVKLLMACISFIGITQGMYNSYLIAATSTLERRFAYDAKLTGFILIADNISQLFISPVIGFLGRSFNKAKLMAIGMIFVSCSCLMTALPYLIYGENQLLTRNHERDDSSSFRALDDNVEYCSATGLSQEDCSPTGKDNHSTLWQAYFIIWMASFLNGIGYTVFYVLGLPYIDDNVNKKKAPLYFSMIACLRMLGPSAGYMLSGYCLGFYENPSVKPDIDPTDPRWIGAWWLGFLFIGVLIFISALPLFILPAQIRKKTEAELAKEATEKETEAQLGVFQTFKLSCQRLASNKFLLYDTISRLFAYLGFGGYYVTKPKYIESQYSQSARAASVLTGGYYIVAMAIGIMAGGIILTIFRPGPRKVCAFIMVVGIFSWLGLTSGLFLGCPSKTFFAPEHITSNQDLQKQGPVCNNNCACTTRVFQPVCGQDGVTNYFSPCFAGCKDAIYNANNTKIVGYSGCTCEKGQSNGTVTSGYCDGNCGDNLKYYLLAISAGKLIGAMGFSGNVLVRLRCVEERDKSLAIGLTKTILALLGSIPYPLIFGWIVDKACLIWETSCGNKGNCWFYDQEKFRNYLHWTSISFLVAATFFDIFVIYYAKDLKDMYKDDEEDAKDDKKKNNNVERERSGKDKAD